MHNPFLERFGLHYERAAAEDALWIAGTSVVRANSASVVGVVVSGVRGSA
jgi:hypothetical protein